MIKNNKGSALVMTITIFVVVTLLVAAILPVASWSIGASKKSNYKQQAQYLARSVAQTIVEYVVNTPDADNSKKLIKQSKDAGAGGVTFEAEGIDADMGTCMVNVVNTGSSMTISATATYMQVSQTVKAELTSQVTSVTNGQLVGASPYVEGVNENVFSTVSDADKAKIEGSYKSESVTILKHDIPDVKKLSIKSSDAIDDRGIQSPYSAYEFADNQSFSSLSVDSYGDVYIIIPNGKTLECQTVTNKFYCGNLYFIVESGGTLKLGRSTSSYKINANIYGEEGSTVVITGYNGGSDPNIVGTCNISHLEINGDNKVKFEYKAVNELSGTSLNTGTTHVSESSNWSLVRYSNGN